MSREIVKYSLLQQRVCKKPSKTATLLRKKKFIYEEALWVALCIHDDRIPFLEWYRQEEDVRKHEPIKVVDLLFTSFITPVISECRSFVIGFKLTDIEPLELAALNSTDCGEWMSCVNAVLTRLAVLEGPSNIYEGRPLPKKTTAPSSPIACSLDDPVPLSPPPLLDQSSRTHTPRESLDAPSSSSRRHSTSSTEMPASPQLSPSAAYERLCMGPSTSNSPPPFRVASPKCPKSPTGHVTLRPPLPPRRPEAYPEAHRHRADTGGSLYDVPRGECVYDAPSRLSSSTVSHSPLTSTISSTSSGSMNDVSCPAVAAAGTPSRHDYEDDRNGYNMPVDFKKLAISSASSSTHSYPVKTASLNLSTLIEHILFVDVGGRVWVAGWSDSHDRQLNCIFSFGDELIEVEGHPVEGIHHVPQLFYTLSMPGTPISLLLRPTPLAVEASLVKPIKPTTPLGIVFHKKKLRIKELEDDSIASRRGLPIELPSMTDPERTSPAVVTSVNGKRLSPFATNDVFSKRLDAIHDGTQFAITLHPLDFFKELKQQLKALRHFRGFMPADNQ